ncbi:hypothetical protein FRC06_008243 [Ceratobasidium sp. 370]|nr:hypothetical protein FRC06_008243 [Ceratobasidium sp. 370]
MGMLQGFLKETGNLSDPKGISAALAEFVDKPVHEASLKDDSRDRVFGATTLRDGARAFLTTIGGFTDATVMDKDRTLLDTLSFQCSLVALSYHEESLLKSTYESAKTWLFDPDHEYDVLSLVDAEDSIREAYMNRLSRQTSGRQLYSRDLELIVESVAHDSMPIYVDHQPKFVKITFLWAWIELLDNDESANLDQEKSLGRCVAHALSFLT